MKNQNKTIEKLEAGHIPDSLSIIHWMDITEATGARLGEELKPLNFMTVGFILGKIDKVVYVQQTWEVLVSNSTDNDCRATQLLLIPEGAIKAIYKFSKEE